MTATRFDIVTAALLAAALAIVATPPAAAQQRELQCPNDIDKDPVGNFPGAEDVDHDGDATLDLDPNVTCRWFAAGDGFADMSDGERLYTFGFSPIPLSVPEERMIDYGTLGASMPGPTITIDQDHELFLNLGNVGLIMRPDLFDPHSVHYHGLPNSASTYDGLPESGPVVNPGHIFSYYYRPQDPGTYFYHCHVEAAEHMQMGMMGNLYVRPAQNGTPKEYPAGSGKFYTQFVYNDGDGSTGYDVEMPLQIIDFDYEFHTQHINIQPLPFASMHSSYPLLNGRGYPRTVDEDPYNPVQNATVNPDENSPTVFAQHVSSRVQAVVGQRILLRLSNISTTSFHTVQVLGIPMLVVGKDARLLRGPTGLDLSYRANSVTMGGGESYDVILETDGLAAGTYFLYSRNLNDLNNNGQERGGLMTEIELAAGP